MTNITERRWGARITAGLAVLALIAGACGGGDEAAEEDAAAAAAKKRIAQDTGSDKQSPKSTQPKYRVQALYTYSTTGAVGDWLAHTFL